MVFLCFVAEGETVDSGCELDLVTEYVLVVVSVALPVPVLAPGLLVFVKAVRLRVNVFESDGEFDFASAEDDGVTSCVLLLVLDFSCEIVLVIVSDEVTVLDSDDEEERVTFEDRETVFSREGDVVLDRSKVNVRDFVSVCSLDLLWPE